MALTKVYRRMQADNSVSVMELGADSTNATDSTVAINAALATGTTEVIYKLLTKHHNHPCWITG